MKAPAFGDTVDDAVRRGREALAFHLVTEEKVQTRRLTLLR